MHTPLRRLLAGAAVLAIAFCAGCQTALTSHSLYDGQDNWVVRQNDLLAFNAKFDLFYLYPSQAETTEDGAVDWSQPALSQEALRYVRYIVQDTFGPQVRAFSPHIPQLGYEAYRSLLKEHRAEIVAGAYDFSAGPLKPAIDQTVAALRFYVGKCNKDRHPFILVGHVQGAVILYEAMKQCKDIKAANGFVVAYLFGLPGMTEQRIARDFRKRGIQAALGSHDLNAIAVCNTRLPDQPIEETFGQPGGYAINPLNWHTDAVPAAAAENGGFRPYYARLNSKASGLLSCGAVAEPESGTVLLTDLPKDTDVELAETAYHSDAWGVFSSSIRDNALERVQKFHFMRNSLETFKNQAEYLRSESTRLK